MLLAVVAIWVVVILVARIFFNGPALARFVTNRINKPIRGKVVVADAQWPLSLLYKPWTIRSLPLEATGIQVFTETGEEVLRIDKITGHIDAWEVVNPLGSHDVIVHDLIVYDGWCIVKEQPSPAAHPDPAFDHHHGDNEIGLLAAMDDKEHRGPRMKPGPIIQINSLELRNVHLELIFYAWEAKLDGLSSKTGNLTNSMRGIGADAPKAFDFEIFPTVTSATLMIPGLLGDKPLEVAFENLVAARFSQPKDRNIDLQFYLEAYTMEGARVTADGALVEIDSPSDGGVDVLIDVADAGKLAARLSQGRAGGADAHAELRFKGPYSNIQFDVFATGVEVGDLGPGFEDVPPIVISSADVGLNLRSMDGQLRDLHATTLDGAIDVVGPFQLFDAPGPSTLCTLEGWLDHQRPCWDLDVTIDPALAVGRFLPDDVAADITAVTAGTSLSGAVRVSGTPWELTATELDVWLGSAHAEGGVHYLDGVADSDAITVDIPTMAASATAHGTVDLDKKRLAVAFYATARKLGPILRKLKQPAIATSATATGTVGGTFDAPRTDADIVAQGVPYAGRVDAAVTHEGDLLTLRRVHARPFGGELRASGRIRLGKVPSFLDFEAKATGLDLARIPGTNEILGGTGRLELTAWGSVARPRVNLTANVDGFSLSGERLGTLSAVVVSDENNVELVELTMGRERGGSLSARGTYGYDTSLDFHLDVRGLPIATLPGVDKALRLDGDASMTLDITGDLADPDVNGQIDLAQVGLLETLLGAAHLEVTAVEGTRKRADGRVVGTSGEQKFVGKMFQSKFGVDGVALLLPPYGLGVRVTFKQVELDEFTSILASSYGARGWVTGYVDLKFDQKLTASVRLSELHLEIDGEDASGRPRPVEIDNVNVDGQHPIAIEYDGETKVARLLEPMQLRGPTGLFTVGGSYGENAIDVSVNGQVELGLVEFFTRRTLDDARGTALVDVRVTGKPDAPNVRGTVELRDAAFTPRNQENVVSAPRGRLVFDNHQVAITGLELAIDGQTLNVDGTVGLKDWQPTTVDARIKGRVAAKLLEVLLDRAITGASGSAAVNVKIGGQAVNPDIDGTLTFDSPFEVSPRGLRREIVLTTGTITFKDQLLGLNALRGTVDEARLLVGGYLRLYAWQFADVEVDVDIDGLSHRIPDVLEVEANSRLKIFGDKDQLQVRGYLDVVDGVFLLRFDYADLLTPQRTTEKATPFWAGNRLLETLLLDLSVKTTGTFRVNTNILSEAFVTGEIRITGTPPSPRLDGRISVDEGKVKIPGISPTFTLRSGTVNFSRYDQPFPGSMLNIEAETIFEDSDERQHTVYARLWGPLSAIQLDLRTDTGLNFGQTAILIMARRTADELREKARGDDDGAPGESSSGGSSTIGGESGLASATDRLVKDFASDFISVLVEAPLKELFGLDCVRIEVGTQSGQMYGCKKLGRALKAEGEYEQGFRGGRRARLGFNWKVHDNIAIVGDYENRRPEDETQEDETRFRAAVKLRFVIP